MAIRRALRGAFEDTYGRAIVVSDSDNPPVKNNPHYYKSIFYGFIGLLTKYKRTKIQGNTRFIVFFDRNPYNIVEQVSFFFPRIIKNILKLGTEFVPFALANLFWGAMSICIDEFRGQLGRCKDKNKSTLSKIGTGCKIAATFLGAGFSLLLWLVSRTIALLGQSILLPFSAMKLTARCFQELGNPILNAALALVHGLLIVAAYTALLALAFYLLPILAPVVAHGAFFSALTKLVMLSGAPLVITCSAILGLAAAKLYLRFYGNNKSQHEIKIYPTASPAESVVEIADTRSIAEVLGNKAPLLPVGIIDANGNPAPIRRRGNIPESNDHLSSLPQSNIHDIGNLCSHVYKQRQYPPHPT